MIIGICGPTGAGKTVIADKLSKELGYKVISQDDYFLSKPPNYYNNFPVWETPDALDMWQFHRNLARAKSNVIVEGFLLYVDERIRNLIKPKIFIDITNRTLISRRISRNGRIQSDDYINNIIVPISNCYALIQKGYSDIIVDGEQSIDTIYENILIYLKECSGK